MSLMMLRMMRLMLTCFVGCAADPFQFEDEEEEQDDEVAEIVDTDDDEDEEEAGSARCRAPARTTPWKGMKEVSCRAAAAARSYRTPEASGGQACGRGRRPDALAATSSAQQAQQQRRLQADSTAAVCSTPIM